MTQRKMELDEIGYMIDDDYIEELNAIDWDEASENIVDGGLFELYESDAPGDSVAYSISLHLNPDDLGTPIIAEGYVFIVGDDDRTTDEIYMECFEALCQGLDDWC